MPQAGYCGTGRAFGEGDRAPLGEALRLRLYLSLTICALAADALALPKRRATGPRKVTVLPLQNGIDAITKAHATAAGDKTRFREELAAQAKQFDPKATTITFIDTAAADAVLPLRLSAAITVDHHGVFGEILASAGRGHDNTSTQILNEMHSLSPEQFDAKYRVVVTDNVADAAGTAVALIRWADVIRQDHRLEQRLRKLVLEEDWSIFGTSLDLQRHDEMAALLGAYDQHIRAAHPPGAIITSDRIFFLPDDKQQELFAALQVDIDRILFSEEPQDAAHRQALADAFRQSVEATKAEVARARVPVGEGSRVLLFDADPVQRASVGPFSGWLGSVAYAREAAFHDGVNYIREIGISSKGQDAVGPKFGYMVSTFFGVRLNSLVPVALGLIEAEQQKILRLMDSAGANKTLLQSDLDALHKGTRIVPRGTEKVFNFSGGRLSREELITLFTGPFRPVLEGSAVSLDY